MPNKMMSKVLAWALKEEKISMIDERKKEHWTETEILSLPLGEHDYFERKSGALLDKSEFHKDLAKALSAFANSGGGHLLIGVKDDGAIDGVPQTKTGRTTTKDWLEQIIPNLLSYPLQNFRVHEVLAATPSVIPAGQVVIVIDVGNSDLAPHQCVHSKVYYHRPGGRSEPANHFYLQMLSRRDVYPGPTIAKAWLGIVINPILGILQSERLYLINGKWTRTIQGESLQKLITLRTPDHNNLSLNLEQILEDHPELERGDILASLQYEK